MERTPHVRAMGCGEKARTMETWNSSLMKTLDEYLPLRQTNRGHDSEPISSSHN